jgi:hypothetical protein
MRTDSFAGKITNTNMPPASSVFGDSSVGGNSSRKGLTIGSSVKVIQSKTINPIIEEKRVK